MCEYISIICCYIDWHILNTGNNENLDSSSISSSREANMTRRQMTGRQTSVIHGRTYIIVIVSILDNIKERLIKLRDVIIYF